MLLPLVRLWDVLTATWAVIFCALPNTCVKFDSIEYSKLSVPSFLKNIVSLPLTVEIPIKSLEIFLMKTVWLSPLNGKLKLAATAVVVPVPQQRQHQQHQMMHLWVSESRQS